MSPPPDGADRRTALLGAAAVAFGVLVAVGLKARCGLPARLDDQYLGLCYSDIGPLWFFERLDEGAVPYLEHAVEYPPLTGLWMWLAAWPADSLSSFFWWTVPILLLAGAVTGALLAHEVGLRGALVVAFAPTLWVSGALNWDLPAVALATAALVAHRRGHDGWSGIAIGLGAAAKLWPVLLLPGVLLGARALRGRRAAASVAIAGVVAWSVVNLPVVSVAPGRWARFFELSRSRGADWDSLWLVVGGRLGAVPDVGTLNLLVGAATVLGVVALLVWTVRHDRPAAWHLVALPVVAWFLLVGKVWSPQFSLWLLPLLALCHPRLWPLVAFALVDLAVTVTRFPYIGGAAGVEGAWPAWPFDLAIGTRAVVVTAVVLVVWRRGTAPAGPRPDGAVASAGQRQPAGERT